MMQFWTLDPPKQWQAGAVGSDRTPIYFSCADCDTKDATIAGIISTNGTFAGIASLKIKGSAFLRPALFCQGCYNARLDAAEATQRAEDACRDCGRLHDGECATEHYTGDY